MPPRTAPFFVAAGEKHWNPEAADWRCGLMTERVAATFRVFDSNGAPRTLVEIWKPVGWLVSERQFRLSTGEPVEQLAGNVFVLLAGNELLTRSPRTVALEPALRRRSSG